MPRSERLPNPGLPARGDHDRRPGGRHHHIVMPIDIDPPEQADPTENFYLQLEVAKMQASEKRFADAYQTLAAVYENLIEHYDEAIDEVIALRKKLSP